MSELFLWGYVMLGLSCGTDAAPDRLIIQAAYDREQEAGSKLHDKGLQVLAAKCDNGASGRFLCQVTFTSRHDPNQRLFFAIVSVTRTGGRWELTSGLCKR